MKIAYNEQLSIRIFRYYIKSLIMRRGGVGYGVNVVFLWNVV